MVPVAVYSSLRRKPESRCRPLVDGQMPLDSGLRRNDVQGIRLCPDIFEHRLSEGVKGFKPEAVAFDRLKADGSGLIRGEVVEP